MHSRFPLYSAVLAFVLGLLWSAAAAGPARVALIDFTTTDNSYRSAVAAANFSALLQAKLSNTDGIEWVERSQLQLAESELKLAAGGFASSAAALQVGKIVKADWLATGQFFASPAGGRELHLDIIDLEHADVLAEASQPIRGATNRPLEISAPEVAAANDKLQTALRQALARSAQTRTQTTIAPLFFANTSSSRRLDYLETELQSALDAASTRPGVRLLRFPRAAVAAGEAELIFAGLVEQDPAAWQKVADVYVWGQYEEVTPDQFAFEQTPVQFTLNIWAGGGELQTVTETAKVSELPELQKRLVQRILTAATAFKRQTVSEQARHEVARQLLLRAYDIQALFRPETYAYQAPSFSGTAQGQQLLHYQAKLLTTAHFFNPESYLAHRLWLECFWAQSPRSFWPRMEQIRSYDAFDDKFGLISPREMESDLPPSGLWLHLGKPRTFDYLLECAWLLLRNEICYGIDGKDDVGFPVGRLPGFPTDTPPDVLKSWQTQISDDFARRLFALYEQAIHADPPVPIINAHLFIDYGTAFDLQDKELKAKFVEDLWPAYLKAQDKTTGRREYSPEEFEYFLARGILAKVRKTFADVGRPEQGEALASQLRQKVKIVVNPSAAYEPTEANTKKVVSINLLPPKLSPNSRPVLFPAKTTVNGVVALKYGNGALWVSTRGGDLNLSDRAWEYLVASHPDAALWKLAPGGTPQWLSPAIGTHSPITSFCLQGDRLWMTLEQDGVMCLGPGGEATHYGDKQGVLSRQMFAGAATADLIYFGGGEPRNGKLNSVDLSGRSWKSADWIGQNHLQIKLLQPLGHYLLVNHAVYDLADGSKHDVAGLLRIDDRRTADQLTQVPAFDILAATADPKAFWLGTTWGLVSYNPDDGTERRWFSLPGGYLVDADGQAVTANRPESRLPGAVTALANDGDFLWVSVTTRFDPSLNGNGSEGDWVKDYYVLTLKPGDYGNAGKWGGWRNMHVRNECNYILLLHKPSGKWVGYFPVTSRVTGLAVSAEKLWIGLEDTAYIDRAEHSYNDREIAAPSPLLEIQKSPLLAITPGRWVSDKMSEPEIHSRIQDAIKILKIPSPPAPPSRLALAEERQAVVQKNFRSFVPVEMKKGADGCAALQRVALRENMIEHNGLYYCGFRFTIPAWLDGDLEWMFVLAKTEAQKALTVDETWGLMPEDGPWAQPEGFVRDELHNYPVLQRQFPYTHTVITQTFLKDQFQPGKSYAVWFELHEKDHPDIACAITIHSPRGTNEFGALPLR